MTKFLFHDSNELTELIGKEVAVSDWLEINQSMIQTFADCTNDHQWIHIDVERAKKESIYGSTIAHGFLTLSLIPYFLESCIAYPFAKRSINYGLNKVRFPHAVTVNSRLRGRFFIQEITSIDGGIQIEWNIIIEIEGIEKPACAADVLFRLYF
jgi:acyl dehydratase